MPEDTDFIPPLIQPLVELLEPILSSQYFSYYLVSLQDDLGNIMLDEDTKLWA
jgi:hypothetical protein